jgi:hypothetical protein
MKLFNEYLVEAESVKEYKFKVKLAMKAEPELMDLIERVLGKYDVKDITSPKQTPIQEHPMDFQNLRNSEVTIFEVTLTYPSTPQIVHADLVNLAGIPGNHVVVINSDHPEEVAREESVKAQGEDYVANLGSEYASGEAPAESKLGFFKELTKETPDIEIAGGKTEKAKTTSDLPQGTKSPVAGR